MEREGLLRVLAPCGLDCGKCLAFRGGEIQRHAEGLRCGLGDTFAAYAERFSGMRPEFGGYEAFRALLDVFAAGSCGGCRASGCLFTACGVTVCVRERGVDFCFQCAEFPCDHHGMPEQLAERWHINNRRMAESGPGAFFERIKDKPRYP